MRCSIPRAYVCWILKLHWSTFLYFLGKVMLVTQRVITSSALSLSSTMLLHFIQPRLLVSCLATLLFYSLSLLLSSSPAATVVFSSGKLTVRYLPSTKQETDNSVKIQSHTGRGIFRSCTSVHGNRTWLCFFFQETQQTVCSLVQLHKKTDKDGKKPANTA